jgi:hypothetical protein
MSVGVEVLVEVLVEVGQQQATAAAEAGAAGWKQRVKAIPKGRRWVRLPVFTAWHRMASVGWVAQLRCCPAQHAMQYQSGHICHC